MRGWQHSFIREINGYVSCQWLSAGESRHTLTHMHMHAHIHTGLGNGYNKSPDLIVYPVSLSFCAYIYISIYLSIHTYIYRETDRQIN